MLYHDLAFAHNITFCKVEKTVTWVITAVSFLLYPEAHHFFSVFIFRIIDIDAYFLKLEISL